MKIDFLLIIDYILLIQNIYLYINTFVFSNNIFHKYKCLFFEILNLTYINT